MLIVSTIFVLKSSSLSSIANLSIFPSALISLFGTLNVLVLIVSNLWGLNPIIVASFDSSYVGLIASSRGEYIFLIYSLCAFQYLILYNLL